MTRASLQSPKQKRSGTVGVGTRQGTKRDYAETLAYDFDLDGMNLAALHAARLVYLDSRTRLALCNNGGRHPSGLVLVRRLRGACGAGPCTCPTSTGATAGLIGAHPLAVRCRPHVTRAHSQIAQAHTAQDARAAIALARACSQVGRWWSQHVMTVANKPSTTPATMAAGAGSSVKSPPSSPVGKMHAVEGLSPSPLAVASPAA